MERFAKRDRSCGARLTKNTNTGRLKRIGREIGVCWFTVSTDRPTFIPFQQIVIDFLMYGASLYYARGMTWRTINTIALQQTTRAGTLSVPRRRLDIVLYACRLFSAAPHNSQRPDTATPQPTLRHATLSLLNEAEGKPLHNRDIYKGLQDSLPAESHLKERLTLTYLKTKILRHLREKKYIRSVAVWTEGKKRASYGYVVSRLPKDFKVSKSEMKDED